MSDPRTNDGRSLPDSLRDWADSNLRGRYGPGLLRIAADEIERLQAQRYQCPDCKCQFVQPFVCTTCGAQKLYDETVRHQAATIEHLRELLWRIQPILNAGSEIAFKVEKVVGNVHTNGDRYEATR